MKSRLVCFLLCFSLVSAIPSQAKKKLPDACGDEKVNFDVNIEKDQPAPPAIEPGKGQIIFIETTETALGCRMLTLSSCDPTIRFGLDGAWAGATRGNSYFAVSVNPGAHDLCAVLGKGIGAETVNVEAGKAYYYYARFTVEKETRHVTVSQTESSASKSLDFIIVDEKQGSDLVKDSRLSTSKPKK
jgi:hypothetical protein